MTGAKSALKVVQFHAGSKKAEDLQLVDYKIQLDTKSTSTKELETYRSQFDLLKSHGVDPIKFIKRKEEEALRNGGK